MKFRPIPQSVRLTRISRLVLLPLAAGLATTSALADSWTAAQADGVVVFRHGEDEQIRWQAAPLDHPGGGEAFRPSAFFHPLRTPAGFEVTAAYPKDHIHHLGLWWPWKHLEIEGTTHNCWELQNGQGAHVAVGAKRIDDDGNGGITWRLENEIRVRKAGDTPPPPVLDGRTVVREIVHMRAARHGDDANLVDLTIRQQAHGVAVNVLKYRYSGFAWRGPEAWDRTNSEMITSGGLDRDKANGSPGSWVLVTGPRPGGTASVLVMSAASEIAGEPERLRVWDSRNHNGTPFVNFNPVQRESMPLDDDHPAVSHRQYRVIAADRKLDAAAAEAEWKAWREEAKAAKP